MYNSGKARAKDEEEICDPVKALHFWYLAHLNGEDSAILNIEKISKNSGIVITEKQKTEWEAEYRNKRS